MKFMKLKFETTLKIYEYIIQHIVQWEHLKMISDIPRITYIEFSRTFAESRNNHRLNIILRCGKK